MASTDGSVSTILNLITKSGGIAFSNNYDVKFRFGSAKIPGDLTAIGININDQTGMDISQGKWINLMCEEAVLPGMQAATSQITGRHMGESQVNYPTARLYNDLSLTWLCDANMTPLKFLHVWMERIFQDYGEGDVKFSRGGQRYTNNQNRVNTGFLGGGNNRYNYVKLAYPEDYLCDELVITKCEKGPAAEQQRSSIAIHCLDAFPYAIDAIPVSYGSSQAVKVTANFYYSKWYSNFNTLWGLTLNPITSLTS